MSDAVDYDNLIPNNVGLRSDRRLQRALEQWHPQFRDWWLAMGPDGFQDAEVYLRTAVGVGRDGWAQFGYVRMPEYRWGILLAPAETDRRIGFGEHKGEPVWQEVPGEYRSLLRRLLVIQGDTEPASVEQQRRLGATAPSLYDLRNLFQVNVEEGRHLWAMVYLLQKYFGRDGREEAETLLRRRSGDADTPRILGAFNEATPDWLSFFLFTTFTDRDGKMQLGSLAQSGFDPLSRTCRFMLTEEAHHMFVGRSGVERILERTCQGMRDAGITDPEDTGRVRALGLMDLPMIQRRIRFHYAVTLDLFGSEVSTNAANAYNAGIKGRFNEDRIDDDHRLHESTYPVMQFEDGAIVTRDLPAISAVNARLCDDYIAECEGVMQRWNKVLEKHGFDYRLALPHRAFNRRVGAFAGARVAPDGTVVDEATWNANVGGWLSGPDDEAYLQSLMRPVYEPGAYAGWISPPTLGIDGKPGDFTWVKLVA